MDIVTTNADKPAVTTTLLAAGVAPYVMGFVAPSDVYYLLLIPPAAYHCWAWFKTNCIPHIVTLLSWFKTKKQ